LGQGDSRLKAGGGEEFGAAEIIERRERGKEAVKMNQEEK